jgi:hypothetical protein
MALKENHPKNQHYVPECLLVNFTDKNERLHVFDKATERTFVTSMRNVAAETYFYDFRDPTGEQHTLEYFLGDVETAAGKILKGILKQGSLAHLTADERAKLSIFVAVQQLRVKGHRHRVRSIVDVVRGELGKRGIDPGDVVPEMDDEEVKLAALADIGFAKETSKHFYDKVWVLHRAPVGTRFYISDNPVTFHNADKRPGPPNLGVSSPGIEIYLPLSPEYTLFMSCERKHRLIAALSTTLLRDVPEAREMVEAVRTGESILVDPPNVHFLNSLQVNRAYQRVFSADGDFDLVRRLLKDYPSLKAPPGVVVWGGVDG